MSERFKRGLSFKDWGIRAILNTRLNTWPPEPIDPDKPFKWQTRRSIKPQPVQHGCPAEFCNADGRWILDFHDNKGLWSGAYNARDKTCNAPGPYPPGLYYVREALRRGSFDETRYAADDSSASMWLDKDTRTVWRSLPWRWKRDTLAGLFMPRDAARLFIRIREVSVERVQDMKCGDLFPEGLSRNMLPVEESFDPLRFVRYTKHLASVWGELWDEINGPGSWDSNPWVWAYKFERVKACDV